MIHFFSATLALSVAISAPVFAGDSADSAAGTCANAAPAGVQPGFNETVFSTRIGQTAGPVSCVLENDPLLGPIRVVQEPLTGSFEGFVLEHRPGRVTLTVDDGAGGRFQSGQCFTVTEPARPDFVAQCQVELLIGRGAYYSAYLNEDGAFTGLAIVVESGTDGGLGEGAAGDAFRDAAHMDRAVTLSMPGLDLTWPTVGYGLGAGHIIRDGSQVFEVMSAARDPQGDLYLRFLTQAAGGTQTLHAEVVVDAVGLESAAGELRILIETMQGTLAEFLNSTDVAQ